MPCRCSIEILLGAFAEEEDLPVMKYASGLAMYETRLAMTPGSATGISDISKLDVPEVLVI